MIKNQIKFLMLAFIGLMATFQSEAQSFLVSEEIEQERKPRRDQSVYELNNRPVVITRGRGLGFYVSRLSYHILEQNTMQIMFSEDDLDEIEYEDEDCQFIEDFKFGNQVAFFYVYENEDLNETKLLVRMLNGDATFDDIRVLRTVAYNDDLRPNQYWKIKTKKNSETGKPVIILQETLVEVEKPTSSTYVVIDDIDNPQPDVLEVELVTDYHHTYFDIVQVSNSHLYVIGRESSYANDRARNFRAVETNYWVYKMNRADGTVDKEQVPNGGYWYMSRTNGVDSYTVQDVFVYAYEAMDPETGETGVYSSSIELNSMEAFTGTFIPVPKNFTENQNYMVVTKTYENGSYRQYANHHVSSINHDDEGNFYVAWAKMNLDYQEGGFFTSASLEMCEYTNVLIQKFEIDGKLAWDRTINRQLTNLGGSLASPQIAMNGNLPMVVYYDWKTALDYRVKDRGRYISGDWDEGDRGFIFVSKFNESGEITDTQALDTASDEGDPAEEVTKTYFPTTFYWKTANRGYTFDTSRHEVYKIRLVKFQIQ